MEKLVLHPNFQNPRDALKRILERPEVGRMIFLVGPTGAGKTTMRQAVLREIVGKPDLWGAGKVPVVETTALLPLDGRFSSKHMANTIMKQLFTPSLNWLKNGDESDSSVQKINDEIAQAKDFWRGDSIRKESEPEQWLRVANMIGARKTWLICIDQAASLCRNRQNMEPADHIENLMSIAEEQRTNFLLCGVQTMAPLWNMRAEIRRRSYFVWVKPYSDRRKEDKEPFLRMLRNFERRFPVAKDGLLISMASEIMAATAGTFGGMENLLHTASLRCQAEDRDIISKDDIESSYASDDSLTTLWHDIGEFEKIMRSELIKERAALVTKRWKIE